MNLQSSYDRVAREYAKRIYDELQHKPLDCELLDRFAAQVKGRGPVYDVGCGPGQIACYLHDRGVEVFGIDLSPGMVAQARRLNPKIAFRQGTMLALDENDDAWGGIVAFYSIIHIPPLDVPRALREMLRVLQPGGLLLVAFHMGEASIHLDALWDVPVSIDTFFFQPAAMEKELATAGFVVEDRIERPPYPDVEYQSRRAYIFARKPDHRMGE